MRGVILLVAAGAAARLNGQGSGLPLQPTRHIRFETHEGTWMSVDVSPDGRTIVFDLLGDLYTVPMAGGRATRITSGIAADYQPRFSPDGRRIVFVSDRDGSFNLWLVAPDGGHPREMTHARYLDQEGRRFLQPVWTPDGRAIVVSESDDPSGSFDLMAYDTLGQAWPDVALRAPAPPASDGAWAGAYYTAGAAFGRDFGGLYATQFTGTHGRWDPQAATYQVIHVAWPNGERRTVTTETGSAVQPLVSPDGRYLAYATTYPSRHGPTTGLRLLDQETGVTKWCLDHIEPSLQGSIVAWQQGLLPNAAFTPDGAAIVVSFDGKLWHVAVPSCQVRPIPFTATVDQKLGPLLRFSTRADDGPATARVIRELQPSPDGKWLAFVALGKVWIVALPDGTSQRLTNARSDQTEYAPAWSPDGRYLAFASWSERGGDIYRVPTATLGDAPRASPERLTVVSDYYGTLAYTPDGSRVVCARAPWPRALRIFANPYAPVVPLSADELQLVSLPAGGGKATALTSLGTGLYEFGGPHFSKRDTTRVFFYAERALWSIRLDGTDRRVVVRAPRYRRGTSGITELLLSPSGDRVLFTASAGPSVWWAPVPLERDSLLLTFGDSTGPGVLRVLTPHGGTDPRWSPDGSRVSFVLGRTWFDVRVGETTAADTAAHRDVVVLVPHDRPEGTLLLSGARVITMSPRGVLARGDVLISGDRITAVGPVATLNVPPHTTRLDITGATVLPGYIATHEHLLGDALGVPAPPRRWDFLLALAYGVTTVLDPQTVSTPAQLSDADRVAAGDLVGPRYLGTGHAVMDQQLDTWDETRDLVREYSRGYHSGFLKERGVGQRLLRQWVAQAAAEERLTSVGHWNHDLVSMILDGYSGIEHTTFMPWHDDVVQLIARSGTIYTPTNLLVSVGPTPVGYFSQRTDMYRERRLWRFAPKDFLDVAVLSPQIGPRPLAFATDYAFPVEAASAVKLAQAGGQVGIATDGALPGLGEHWEIWLQVIGGMVPLQALRSATLTGAVAVGLERDLGSIEPGKLADLQVLDRNPLVDIHNTNTLRYVMKDGRLYKAATLDEIWPERRPLVRGLDDQPWWWADAPPGTLDTGPRRRQ